MSKRFAVFFDGKNLFKNDRTYKKRGVAENIALEYRAVLDQPEKLEIVEIDFVADKEKIQQLEKEVERLKIELLKAREYEFMYKECSK